MPIESFAAPVYSLSTSANALQVLEARYLLRDKQHNVIETPDQLIERVANAIAQAETDYKSREGASYWADRFRQRLVGGQFLPNSPTLMNAGTALGQLSACFVLPIADTMEGIFETLKDMALVQRSGGGTGFSFTALRPSGDIVASTGGEASGPVSFMKIFDCATENIKQGGKRRGANMGVLQVDHPDILEFIRAKRDLRSLSNFNLSVSVTDHFMYAAANGQEYELRNPRTGQAAGSIKASEVFDAIATSAWETGDPGLLFFDTINRANPTPALGALEVTNPCGEVPLLPYEACNLGAVNLARLVAEKRHGVDFDWTELMAVVTDAIRFLDNVITVNRFPLPVITKASHATRKVGLGVMGFAETLVRLGISYDSQEAEDFAEQVMGAISKAALRASQTLAAQRGPFPEWRHSKYKSSNLLLRNATRTAIAPTGTIGILAGTSASIEPFFALAYRRKGVLNGRILREGINELFLEYLERHHLNPGRVLDAVATYGRLADIPYLPVEMKRLFVTALDISPNRQLKIQAAFQRHVDNSVSKTINLPNTVTSSQIARIFFSAWQIGLKGITVYRYASRPEQVLELGIDDKRHAYEHGTRCDPEECRL